MKVYYDLEYRMCAAHFDKDDTILIQQEQDGLTIYSGLSGRPEIIEKQLLFPAQRIRNGIRAIDDRGAK